MLKIYVLCKKHSPLVVSFQDVDAEDKDSFQPVDWENTSTVNFDINEFENGIESNSPVKTGYELDSDYEPESEHLSPTDIKEEKVPL